MTDILIVGAGPVGLTMASELRRYGVNVRLIDKAAEATQISKAVVIWSRTLELMDRMGCTPVFIDAGLKAVRSVMHSVGDRIGEVDLTHVSSPYRFVLMVPQNITEQLLGEHLARLGGSVERQSELLSFTEEADRVQAKIRHADGSIETLEVPWLIGCDGAHSVVRHGIGQSFEGSTQADDWLLADVRLEGDGMPSLDELSVHFHHDGPFMAFPLPGGRRRIVAEAGRTNPDQPRPDATLADVQAMIDQRTAGGYRATDPNWLAYFHINERMVSDYRSNRVFLAGDAAHIHSPAGGQGMNTGMHDAVNLSWKLALVVRGEASPAILSSYSPERHAVGRQVLAGTTKLTDMGTLSNPVAIRVRNAFLHVALGLPFVQHKMAEQLSEIDIHYPEGALTAGSRGGKRLDPAAYAGPPPGAGKAPRFVLYADGGAAVAAAEIAARYPRLVEAGIREPADPDALLIVRPDGYIGLSAEVADLAAVEDFLAAIAPD